MSGHLPPVLVEGLDPVLLIRMYPDAAGITDAGTMAVAQGEATGLAGETLESSQYEPVLGAEAPPPTQSAPTNTTVPNVSQSGTTLTCTQGTWTGTPTSYSYAWLSGVMAIGTDSATYDVLPADVGTTVTCVVTATNAAGSTAAPPSNGVVVV